MKRRLVQLCVLAAALAVDVRAHSDAPPDQYNVFAPTDKAVRDAFTHLEWWRETQSMLSFSDAKARCATGLGPVYRVPTLRELLTLFDEEPHLVYQGGQEVPRFIDRNAFPGTDTAQDYWTSTVQGGTGRPWTLSFGTGATDPTPVGDLRAVLCVRSYP